MSDPTHMVVAHGHPSPNGELAWREMWTIPLPMCRWKTPADWLKAHHKRHSDLGYAIVEIPGGFEFSPHAREVVFVELREMRERVTWEVRPSGGRPVRAPDRKAAW